MGNKQGHKKTKNKLNIKNETAQANEIKEENYPT